MGEIVVKRAANLPMDEQPVEIVERKGKGHPDTICDSIMDRVSIELSKEYLKRYGRIFHHNIDKGLLAAGKAKVSFGGGEIVQPMLLVFGDRATFKVNDDEIPVGEIAVDSAKKWIRENLRFVDPEKHVKYQVEIKEGAAALVDIFKRRPSEVLGANDTSASVGYAPMSKSEKLVFNLENWLNSPQFKKQFPETGEDIKIMCSRIKNKVTLTIAMPLIDRYIPDEDSYFKRKREVINEIENFIKEFKAGEEWDAEIEFSLNTLDERGRGISGLYLTVTGTSAEDGDSGQVGRGNMVNGVIPLNRPTGSEAAAGKNPVSHVGKIYNILTFRMAGEIYKNVSGIKEVYVWLLSQIGVPINKPKLAAVEIVPMQSVSVESISPIIKDMVEKELSTIGKFCMDLAVGKYKVC
ncbi:MAG: methionine adenosyltransferase [Thermoproteota archaeon]|nr:MAG: methionine adenosyltransferase [Candidatus Korarchaeota archaeon]